MLTRHNQTVCQMNQSISYREESRRPRFLAEQFRSWQRILPMVLLVGLLIGWGSSLMAAAEEAASPLSDEQKKQLAVSLNYTRASLHRIRESKSKKVLIEERDNILNRLNLNRVVDEDVMKLYSSILDEISGVQIAERERGALDDRYVRVLQRDLGLNTLQIMTEVASTQYVSAFRTGANSFLDHRNQAANHEMDQWQVEKKRMESVVQKSTQFLDVTWKLCRSKNIPDVWLVRTDDLDKLDMIRRNPDLEVRLRMLRRMEKFMQCYPPYYYHLARTLQEMNNMHEASTTYEKLITLNQDHFHKDEMLATALANRAMIQVFLGEREAVETAQKALDCNAEPCQANLVCAGILQKYGHYERAEEALLHNIDEDYELPSSRTALLGLYYATDNRAKLAEKLNDEKWVHEIPAQVLIACAAKIGQSDIPLTVVDHLTNSLKGTPRKAFARTDFLVMANRSWNLQHAVVTLHLGDKTFSNPRLSAGSDNSQILTFDGVANTGFLMPASQNNSDVSLSIKYPDSNKIKLVLSTGGNSLRMANFGPIPVGNLTYPVYSVSAFEQNNVQLSMKISAIPSLKFETPILHTTAKRSITTEEEPVKAEEVKGDTN